MDQTAIKQVARDTISAIAMTQENLAKQKGMLESLRDICDHSNRKHEGTGYHGSDAGYEHYKCKDCGKEWKE